MASKYVRLMDPTTLSASLTQDRDLIVDLGAYKNLIILARILKAGSGGGKVKLKTAAVLGEPTGWVDLLDVSAATVEVSVDATGNTMKAVNYFLRYVRWECDGSVGGSPVATIDIIAKE
jgi:hypothetical protein